MRGTAPHTLPSFKEKELPTFLQSYSVTQYPSVANLWHPSRVSQLTPPSVANHWDSNKQPHALACSTIVKQPHATTGMQYTVLLTSRKQPHATTDMQYLQLHNLGCTTVHNPRNHTVTPWPFQRPLEGSRSPHRTSWNCIEQLLKSLVYVALNININITTPAWYE